MNDAFFIVFAIVFPILWGCVTLISAIRSRRTFLVPLAMLCVFLGTVNIALLRGDHLTPETQEDQAND